MEKIYEFRGDYRFLSNFYPCEVEYEGIVYPSVENAFQAAKTLNNAERLQFTNVKPGIAKRLGRKVALRHDWEKVKVDIMKELLRKKFSQEHLKSKLLETGDRELEEGNRWNDRFWGICPPGSGMGKNILGRLIMEIRGELRKGK